MRYIFLFILLINLICLSGISYGESDTDKFEQAHVVDTGFFTGKITQIVETDKKVKVNVGIKNGLDEKSKGKVFTIHRESIPIAKVKLSDVGQDYAMCDVLEIIKGVTLKTGDDVTSEINQLDIRDLKFLNNPYCKFISKTLITDNNDYYLWKINPMTIDIIGDVYLFTSYSNKNFGNTGADVPTLFGGNDESLLYLFNNKGEKKWGFYANSCIFKDFNIKWRLFHRKLYFTEPDYQIYGSKIYFNGYNIRPDLWVPLKHIKSGGLLVNLDLKSGKELWRITHGGNYDPAFYSIIYGKFIDEICYLYSTKSAIYAVDLSKGEFIWEYNMRNDSAENGIFDEKGGYLYASDDDGYFYKIDKKTGKEVWNIKFNAPLTRIHHSPVSGEKIIYAFDGKQTIMAIDTEKGTSLWTYKGEAIFSCPELNQMHNDVIYAFELGNLVTLSPGGQVQWRCAMKSPLPVYFENGTIYCISDKKNLVAVNTATGRVKWTYGINKEIVRVLPIKDTFYIFDENNIYMVDKTGGKEFFRKSDFQKPVYLEKIEPSIDPYNIMNLGKVKNEDDLIFIAGRRNLLCIDPVSHKIILEKDTEEEFSRVMGDPENIYLISLKHIWAIDVKTGNIKWDKPFEEELNFVAKPPEGGIYYYDEDETYPITNTINSMSRKLIGMRAGMYIYVLNKETGEVISQGKEEETVYPYLEIEAMNKIKEKMEGIYFYPYKDCLYTFKSIK